MIQIQHPGQFEKAAARLERERMGVRRSEAHLYEVTNRAKGVRYHVRFTRHDGHLFASCDRPAGAAIRSCASTSRPSSSSCACPADEAWELRREGDATSRAPLGFASDSEQGQKGNEPPT